MNYAMRRGLSVLALGGGLMVGNPLACAERVTKVEKTIEVGEDGPSEVQDRGVTTTETTTSESESSSPGIIGSAFGFVWAVISFPFRVIADLF